MVKTYLSHGMGLNSTALMLMMWEKGVDFESVFVNHGGDYPYTYEYCNYLINQGFPITVLKPNVEGCDTIEKYCDKYHYLPTFRHRWCTDKFKIRVLKNYFEKPCICNIGIAWEEKKRVKNIRMDKFTDDRYPLIDDRIDRGQCIDIIKDYGIQVPKRSSCWLCPFMKKSDVRLLYLYYNELYERRKKIEKECIRDDFYLTYGHPIESLGMECIPDILIYI